MRRKLAKPGRLFYKLSIPMFILLLCVIGLFSAVSSYILIRAQNDHAYRMAEQSLTFVYRSVGYQLATMNNTAAFVLSNPSFEKLLDTGHERPYEAIGDFFELQSHLENLSLVSLLNEYGPAGRTKTTYVIAVALEPSSGLYEVATDEYYPATGLYKSDRLRQTEWYSELHDRGKQTAWWGEQAGVKPSVFVARSKTSFRDGHEIGTVLVGADMSAIQGVMAMAPIEKGYHLLLDEADRVIYSDKYPFLEDLSGSSIVRAMDGSRGSAKVSVNGERHIELYETLDNGWKVISFMPASHIGSDTLLISLVGVLIGILGVAVTGFLLRRIIVKVTVPVIRLVGAMQRPDVLEGKEPLPTPIGGIREVDELYRQFASMLVVNRELAVKAYRDEIAKKQLHLELLQSQINPHFLYNSLDLINCRAILAGDRDTSKLVRSLANVFRFGLNKGKTWIPLADEIRQATAYLDIQTMMLADLAYSIEVPPSLADAPVIHLIVQPLAENCIVHGFANRTERCRIRLSCREEDGKLILCVEDNGGGADAAELNRRLLEAEKDYADPSSPGLSGGYGTLNVHRRIRLHCGEGYGLRYVEVPEGTRAEAVLPSP
ncbi:sensor histidine kinase [Cohnella faecalis]|uniref:Sensor histidine kinase n=1 Tax=Cohnella faecalis TaxID=2315694 RepID=A0A398CQ32_9BACL|nr:histidine kinase [Cohnella faecalis]RIE04552.1 sensor histidine kinase [Cohnella faecalis]